MNSPHKREREDNNRIRARFPSGKIWIREGKNFCHIKKRKEGEGAGVL